MSEIEAKVLERLDRLVSVKDSNPIALWLSNVLIGVMLLFGGAYIFLSTKPADVLRTMEIRTDKLQEEIQELGEEMGKLSISLIETHKQLGMRSSTEYPTSFEHSNDR